MRLAYVVLNIEVLPVERFQHLKGLYSERKRNILNGLSKAGYTRTQWPIYEANRNNKSATLSRV